jgi:hypothetical protein
MSKNYQIIGDVACHTERVLFETTEYEEAIRWAKGYCRRDLGGYESITVLYYQEDGEAIDLWRMNDDD